MSGYNTFSKSSPLNETYNQSASILLSRQSIMSSLPVYTGLWIDRSLGTVNGATLTLPVRWSLLLTSSLMLLATFAAASTWNIITFLLHQRRASKISVDGVDLLHQVLLRNSPSSASTLFEALKIQFAWGGTSKRVIHRTLRIAIPAIGMLLAATAASLLVGEVASKQWEEVSVPLEPVNCGFVEFRGVDSPDSFLAYGPWVQNITLTARAQWLA